MAATQRIVATRIGADLASLMKPRVTLLVVLTALGGMALAPGALHAPAVASMLLAIALVVGSANTLNCWLERDSDRLMARTRARPLPAGRMSAQVALGFGLSLAFISLPWLLFGGNALTAALGALALVSYVALYTPLKRKSPLALYVGAVPGALPPLMGFTAITGELGAVGLALFAVLLVWQIPHFLAIGMFRSAEYENAGLRAWPVVHGHAASQRHAIVTIALLLPVSFSLVALGTAGALYGCVAVAASAAWAVYAVTTARRDSTTRWARRMFVASLAYLPLLVMALLVDSLFRST